MVYTLPIAGDASTTTATAIDANFKEAQQGLNVYAADSVGTDAYAITVDPAITAYVAGQRFAFKAATANTGACTLAVSGLSAVAIKKNVSQALDSSDILANQIVEVRYDGTNFQLCNPPSTGIRGFSLGFHGSLTGVNQIGGQESPCGYSGGSNNRMTFACFGSASGDGITTAWFDIATDVGLQPYIVSTPAIFQASLVSTKGTVHDGSAYWHSDSNNNIKKNGTNVTIASGGSVNGPLGHNPTSSYLLMLTTTTNIRRWSGIAGTTITLVDNITLDTAVTQALGFVYDSVNDQYVCVDSTNNLLRRFTNAGVTVDTTAYTCSDGKVVGIEVIGRRVYLVMQNSGSTDGGSLRHVSASVFLVPTALVL